MNASPRLEIELDGKVVSSRDLSSAGSIVIGRGEDADLRVESGKYMSRRHAEVRLEGGKLHVRRLPEASNPVYYGGGPKDEFTLEPGESFVIGSTRFRFVAETTGSPAPQGEPTPAAERVMSSDEVYAVSDRMRLKDLLELPEILRGQERHDFQTHIASTLRMATGSGWAAVVARDGRILGRDAARDDAEIKPSRALMDKAWAEHPRPIFHCWRTAQELNATAVAGVDWAVCAAVEMAGGEPIFFYVAGSGGAAEPEAPANLDNTRYVGLVADMVGRSLSVQRLEEWETRLQRFFSGPIVEKILSSPDLKDLAPKIAQSAVLFFDVRGFSKRTEGKNEKILAFQGELRKVMTAMTEEIFKENGVVLQYMGDGIMACWNVPFAVPDYVDCACRAALRMAKRLPEVAEGWKCGIGLHTGEVVAGAMGSDQLFSYSLMGAVVNQASRIEGITKAIEVPILISKETAEKLSPAAGAALRLGTFQPAGMNVHLDLYELSEPPADGPRAVAFGQALKAIEAGEWEHACEALHGRPLEDMPARYLTLLAEQYRRHPPKDWRGVIELTEK